MYMNKKLEQAYQNWVATKTKFIQRLERMTPSQLIFQSDENEWSPLLVLDHIIVSENKVILRLQENSDQQKTEKVGIKSRLANAALAQFYKSGKKVKMPIKGLEPSGNNLEHLKQTSNHNNESMHTMIQGFPEHKLRSSVFKHPVSGHMTMQHTIEFLENHILHHVHQLNRIERHANYPHN